MKCPICGGEYWKFIYDGNVRDGNSGKVQNSILECNYCTLQRLKKFYDPKNYDSNDYREHLGEQEWDYSFHDEVQKHHFHEMPSVRGKTVIEVGCGAGSFLDLIAKQAGRVIGIEPHRDYRRKLLYETYAYPADAPKGIADVVVSFDVIEHVEDPVEFMESLGALVKPDGKIIVSTPNRNEILMQLLPEFREFRYQSVHNWYFDAQTLGMCVQRAGLWFDELRTIHRYGLSNTIGWLMEKRPVGDINIPMLSGMKKAWQGYLNDNMLGENLWIECRRRVV